MQNPWIFRQFEDVLAGRKPYQPDLTEKKDVLLEFFSMCREEMPEIVALGKDETASPGSSPRALSAEHNSARRCIIRTRPKKY